jgi:hypothetical protein
MGFRSVSFSRRRSGIRRPARRSLWLRSAGCCLPHHEGTACDSFFGTFRLSRMSDKCPRAPARIAPKCESVSSAWSRRLGQNSLRILHSRMKRSFFVRTVETKGSFTLLAVVWIILRPRRARPLREHLTSEGVVLMPNLGYTMTCNAQAFWVGLVSGCRVARLESESPREAGEGSPRNCS